MSTAKRIEMYLLGDELKSLINAGMKIFPVPYSFIQANLNPDNFEYVKVTDTTDHKREIYTWDEGWKLIGADDTNVSWSDIPDKPSSYVPSPHDHNELYSVLGHTHSEYASSFHNHDEVYSTLGHKHTESDITDLNKYTKEETNTLLGGKANTSHDHDGRYYQKSEVTTLLSSKSDTSHTHTDLHTHANKTVVDKLTQTHIDALDNGLSNGHTHGNLAVLSGLTDVSGQLQYNGQEIGGTVENLTDTELTLGSFKLSFNTTTNSLDIVVV